MNQSKKTALRRRPLAEADIPLISRWLYAGYVRPWFENPFHWLEEIARRNGVFVFITHLIAGKGGKSVGLCQCYDCLDARDGGWENGSAAWKHPISLANRTILGKDTGRKSRAF
jgi:hypothetical protein